MGIDNLDDRERLSQWSASDTKDSNKDDSIASIKLADLGPTERLSVTTARDGKPVDTYVIYSDEQGQWRIASQSDVAKANQRFDVGDREVEEAHLNAAAKQEYLQGQAEATRGVEIDQQMLASTVLEKGKQLGVKRADGTWVVGEDIVEIKKIN